MAWDEAVLLALNRLAGHSRWVDALMVELGHAGNYLVPVILVFVYWIWTNRREAILGALSLVGLVVLADFIGAQVKHLAARPRPCRVLEGLHEVMVGACGGTFSFPSNHAMNAAAAAAFMHVLYPRTGWVTWPLVAVTGVSRVYVAAHFPTDVAGGWLMGGLMGLVGGWLLSRWWGFGRVSRPLTLNGRRERPSVD